MRVWFQQCAGTFLFGFVGNDDVCRIRYHYDVRWFRAGCLTSCGEGNSGLVVLDRRTEVLSSHVCFWLGIKWKEGLGWTGRRLHAAMWESKRALPVKFCQGLSKCERHHHTTVRICW